MHSSTCMNYIDLHKLLNYMENPRCMMIESQSLSKEYKASTVYCIVVYLSLPSDVCRSLLKYQDSIPWSISGSTSYWWSRQTLLGQSVHQYGLHHDYWLVAVPSIEYSWLLGKKDIWNENRNMNYYRVWLYVFQCRYRCVVTKRTTCMLWCQ